MYCRNCGYKNDDNAKFCQKCGEKLDTGRINTPSESGAGEVNLGGAAAAVPKSKSAKNIIIAVIAVILAVAVVVTACVVVVPKLKKDTINNDTYVASNGAVFAVMEDGTVKSTVYDGYHEDADFDTCDYTVSYDLSSWQNIKSISAGNYHVVGLKEDGTCVAEFGTVDIDDEDLGNYNEKYGYLENDDYFEGNYKSSDENCGQCSVNQWTDIVQICAADNGTVGLKSDGTLVYAGEKSDNINKALKWTDIVSIYYDKALLLGVKSDGTVASAGYYDDTDDLSEYYALCQDAVSQWTDIEHIYGNGWLYYFGITSEGKVVTTLDKYMDLCLEDDEDSAFKETFESGLETIKSWTDIEKVFVMSTTACAFVVGTKSDGSTVAATIIDYTADYTDQYYGYEIATTDEVINQLTNITDVVDGYFGPYEAYDGYQFESANAFLMPSGKLVLFDPENTHTDYNDNEEFLTWSNIKTSSDEKS